MPLPSTFTQFEELPFYSTETNQFHDFGQLAISQRGKMFRYVKAGGSTLTIGNLIQGPARSTNFTDMAIQAAVATSVSFSASGGGFPIPVTLGASSTTASQFVGGGLYVTSGASQIGQTFEIVNNDVATNGTTCNFYTLEQPLVALTTSGTVTANINPYNGVIQSPTTITGPIVGVAVTAITNAQFGWVQTHGEVAVLSDATVATIGQGVQRSTGTAGAVTQATTNGFMCGQAIVLGVSAEDEPVFLTID